MAILIDITPSTKPLKALNHHHIWRRADYLLNPWCAYVMTWSGESQTTSCHMYGCCISAKQHVSLLTAVPLQPGMETCLMTLKFFQDSLPIVVCQGAYDLPAENMKEQTGRRLGKPTGCWNRTLHKLWAGKSTTSTILFTYYFFEILIVSQSTIGWGGASSAR